MELNPRLIRWIDKNLGIILCFVFTLYRRVLLLFKRNQGDFRNPHKILFIKLVEQGSIVLAYSALKKAEKKVGRENIYFMVFKKNRPILDILQIIPSSNIIEIDSSGILRFFFSVISGLYRIRREKVDTVIDMEFFSRATAILAYLSGADKRVGLHRFNCEGLYRGDLFTHRLIYNPYLHTKVLFLSLVEALNYEPPLDEIPMIFKVPKVTVEPPTFFPTEEEKKSIIEKIEQLKGSSLTKPVIVLNPKIGDLLPARRWSKNNYIKLAMMILEDFPHATIIITGDTKDKKEDALLASQMRNAISLAGHISLRELLTLYFIAEVLVTSDSGPAHFSTLTPIKSVILFGPETPFLYGPERNEKRVVIAQDLVCSPCVSVYNQRRALCRRGECVKNIKVEEIYKIVKDFLQE